MLAGTSRVGGTYLSALSSYRRRITLCEVFRLFSVCRIHTKYSSDLEIVDCQHQLGLQPMKIHRRQATIETKSNRSLHVVKEGSACYTSTKPASTKMLCVVVLPRLSVTCAVHREFINTFLLRCLRMEESCDVVFAKELRARHVKESHVQCKSRDVEFAKELRARHVTESHVQAQEFAVTTEAQQVVRAQQSTGGIPEKSSAAISSGALHRNPPRWYVEQSQTDTTCVNPRNLFPSCGLNQCWWLSTFCSYKFSLTVSN